MQVLAPRPTFTGVELVADEAMVPDEATDAEAAAVATQAAIDEHDANAPEEVPATAPGVDWSQAKRYVHVQTAVLEALVLDGHYHMGHAFGPVEGQPGDMLCRYVETEHAPFVMSADAFDARYIPIADAEAAPPVEGEPGVATIVGDPLIIEGPAADAVLAALGVAGLMGAATVGPEGANIPPIDTANSAGDTPAATADDAVEIGGPATDVEAIDPAKGMDPSERAPGEVAPEPAPPEEPAP